MTILLVDVINPWKIETTARQTFLIFSLEKGCYYDIAKKFRARRQQVDFFPSAKVFTFTIFNAPHVSKYEVIGGDI